MEKVRFEDVFYHDVSIVEIKISHNNKNSAKQLTFVLEDDRDNWIKCHIKDIFAISIESHFRIVGANAIIDVDIIDNDSWVLEEINIAKQYPVKNLEKYFIAYKIVTSYGEIIKIILESDFVYIEECGY